MDILKDWQTVTVAIAFIYLTIEFIVYKGFGKKAFLLSLSNWAWRLLNSNNEIRKLLEAQDKTQLEQSELIYKMLVKVESIEREVKWNGGSKLLRDVVGDIYNCQAVFASEEEAKLYIDPKPIYKMDATGNVTFVNAAWLEMIGCTDEDEVMGLSYMIAVPEEDKTAVANASRLFAKSPAPFHGQFVYQHLKTRQRIKTNVRSQLIRDKNKEVVGTIGVVTILGYL